MSTRTEKLPTIPKDACEPLGAGETFTACSMDLIAEYQNGKYKIEEGKAISYSASDTLEITIPASTHKEEPNNAVEYTAGGMGRGRGRDESK